ncbi:crotonobetainyl-CoA:carnitine CoA-transferase CaiB-like acyl-CoA transferase [Halomonas fontilapidosi]|uniref:Crotonobetainyl-CoA:carnitine CoA-transferase CaiB-like acyl-CoA transferase n=1 Tax=Halomonas fontilapidosi TaxID=616675 RepID=A0A7W5GYZ4_9GAMM|nr:CoA transferase [Halomonas fontilapidosi]MBB3184130.1 crotonobetainyl-CoA:carnitine CoA-transferase CaiB-like acyl-CoA transferase [Halomonas fontilapidosi]
MSDPHPPATGSLAGIRVIDLTRVISGPFCTQILGDHGAEVIKVESPGRGDVVRDQGNMVNGFSWYFAQFNRNKRSMTLDLRQEAGKAVLHRLLEEADVLVENFRPGVLAKMGLDDETLRAQYPRLVVGRINGFGSTGPYRDRPAYDFIAQAMSGFMGVNGPADGEPMRAAPPISDMVASQNLAFGICAALVRRERSGQGDIVETALTNGLIGMMGYLAAEFFATDRVPARTGNDHPMLYPYGLFRASDGEVAIAPSNDTMVERLLRALGLLHLLDDERFADNARRMANREALRECLTAVTETRSVEAWIDHLNRAGVPCGRVHDLRETFADPQVQAQQMRLELDQGELGRIPVTGFPVKMQEAPAAVHHPVPRLGEHTREVLAELGLDDEELKALEAQGVV